MNFENEPLENEDERELQSEESGAADFDADVAEAELDASEESAAPDTEADAESAAGNVVADESFDSTLIGELPPETDESADGISVTPSSEAIYIDASNGTFASSEDAEGGFIELEPRGAPAAEGPSSFDESRSVESGPSDLSPRSQAMLNPTSDGGPPLARPIIIVRLADDQMEYLVNEICKRMAKRNEQTCRELVQHLINQEFWRRDCQERAIIGQHRR